MLVRKRSGLAVVVPAIFAICLMILMMSEGTASDAGLKKVTFTFTPTGHYEQVFLAGTFNGWSTDATPMQRKGNRFEISLPLPMGDYQYKFVADGQWITDEKAERFHPDGYGGRNSVVVVDESFQPWDMARGDGDMMTEGLRHSDDAWERSLSPDGTITIRARAWMGDVEMVTLTWHDIKDSLPGLARPCPPGMGNPMVLVDSDGTYDYYGIQVGLPSFYYYFTFIDGPMRVILDEKGVRDASERDIRPFHFDASQVAAFSTPDWVKDAVIYQIFPERFANGNSANDPDFSEWYYEGLTTLPPSGKTNGEYFHLITDWYDVAGLNVSPYKTDGKPDWNSFYGGDIAGVRQNLDYLEDLGITAIYFNPIFEAKSNHKYDAADYMKIDPHFATNEEFAAFVADCHGRGIRVIIDLAINHTGHTFWAFVDARERGRESEYWDWYEWKQWPIPGNKVWTPANASDYYDCWWNFGQMPNLNFDLAHAGQDEQKIKDIADAQPNWPVVNHLLEMAEYWLEEADVDGYRLDVASDVPFWFWELFRERVKQTKSDAYIVGELWGASPEWINGKYFDATMNYKFFRDPVLAFIARGDITAPEFDRALAPGRLIYQQEGVQVMMNLLASHDTERFLTTAGGDVRRLKLALLFGMTYVGAPTVYYGDEVAMVGGGDPDCRRPFYWKWPDEAERVGLHDYCRNLIRLRQEHRCLARGDFRTLLAEGTVFAYHRSVPGDEAIILLNAGTEETMVSVPVKAPMASLKDVFTGETVAVSQGPEGMAFTVTLPVLTGTVYMPADQ
jgi:glycosidase